MSRVECRVQMTGQQPGRGRSEIIIPTLRSRASCSPGHRYLASHDQPSPGRGFSVIVSHKLWVGCTTPLI